MDYYFLHQLEKTHFFFCNIHSTKARNTEHCSAKIIKFFAIPTPDVLPSQLNYSFLKKDPKTVFVSSSSLYQFRVVSDNRRCDGINNASASFQRIPESIYFVKEFYMMLTRSS